MSVRNLPDMMRGSLAMILVGAFMVSLSWLFRHAIPQPNEQLVTFMLGQLSGFAGAAVAYYLGTSKSSNDKDDILRLPPPRPDDVAVEPYDLTREMPRPTFGMGDKP